MVSFEDPETKSYGPLEEREFATALSDKDSVEVEGIIWVAHGPYEGDAGQPYYRLRFVDAEAG
jgi:hypothetical protein